jgi:5'-nucleotidase
MRTWRATTGALGALALGAGLLVAAPASSQAAEPAVIQILGINDFHGRISANQTEAGAAVLAGAVDQLRTDHPNTVFAAAGDLIGASTFESFIAHDSRRSTRSTRRGSTSRRSATTSSTRATATW